MSSYSMLNFILFMLLLLITIPYLQFKLPIIVNYLSYLVLVKPLKITYFTFFNTFIICSEPEPWMVYIRTVFLIISQYSHNTIFYQNYPHIIPMSLAGIVYDVCTCSYYPKISWVIFDSQLKCSGQYMLLLCVILFISYRKTS